MKAAKDHEGSVPTRASGNYASDEAKEIERRKSFGILEKDVIEC